MARLEDIYQPTRDNIVAAECPVIDGEPFVDGPPLSERKIAILSSAALYPRGGDPILYNSGDYLEIPASLPNSEILMSHVSINFDRSGWQRDINVVYPIDRMRELAAEGVIGEVADVNFTVLGATEPTKMLESVESIAARVKRDQIDSILLSPV
jgi:D-proline reductase (dithiol) PrdB